MDAQELNNVIELLSEISEDTSAPKNIRSKMSEVSKILKESTDHCMKINKALNELDEVVNDHNMQQFTRTQIWNVVSLLEKV
jgi:uncharacterized protein (UPF0147 family)